MRWLGACVVVLASACLDFERRVNDCFDGGRCVSGGADGGSDGGATGDGGAPADGGGDGGGTDAGVEPLLYPGFCAEGWCWEAPLPHGTRLTAVYGDGDDVIVAGDNGMLAERSVAGGWRSLQSAVPAETQWRGLWGRSSREVYLAGASQVWLRADGGWTSGIAPHSEALTAVTGTASEVLFGDGSGRVLRLGSGGLELVAATDAGEILSMTPAYGALFALTRPADWPATALVKLDGGRVDFDGDGGELSSVFGWDTGLWLAGQQGFSVSSSLVATPIAGGLTAGSVGPTGVVRAANPMIVGTLVGQSIMNEQLLGSSRVEAMHEGPSTTWAVGEAGLVLQRRDGGWRDLATDRPSVRAVRAITAVGDSLVAVSEAGQLLVRGTLGWRERWGISQRPFVDVVAADDSRAYVLTEDQSVITVRRSGMSWQEEPPRAQFGQGTAAHRLWLTPAGTLVATSDEGLFFRRRGDLAFTHITGTARLWGVAGRRELVRACGGTEVVEVDLSQPSPMKTIAGTARDCRAVVALADGWANSGQDQDGVPFVVRTPDGATFHFRSERTAIGDMELVPGGLAVGINGVGLVPIDAGLPRDLDPLPTRVSQVIFGLVAWRGRLFAVGEQGLILQGPLP
ncbi:MAG: hypothetical protein JNJ54_02305 [Myxococcaceae bacterium]|nr:hypothetical protein [Myxococcaceae bacterium]